MSRATIMVVDDERNMLRTLESILRGSGFDAVLAESGQEALSKLAGRTVHLVVTDARMAGMDGFQLLEQLRQRYPQLPVLMMTAYATPKLAVQAIKAGAVDYIAKPFQPEEFLHVIGQAVQGELLQRENRELKGLLGRRFRIDDLIGKSAAMQAVRELIRQSAPTEATVLVVGESGTGKEMAAGALHSLSERRNQPFVGINCAAIPENLLESELFGHERGAFTGAVRQRIGRFEEANGGTLFLDEIGDMGPHLQSKLLRVLEERSFQRLGGSDDVRVDVRVVAATNQEIRAALASGQLRSDLYHRLNVVRVDCPPLRDRGGDIPELAAHFLQQFNQTLRKQVTAFSEESLAMLEAYHWPGNVRELRNVVERAVIVETTNQIRPVSLPTSVGEPERLLEAAGSLGEARDLPEAVARFERELIERAVRRHHGRIGATAEGLGISRHALRYRMQRLGMTIDEVL